jgi:hypothetical protein
MTIGDENHHEKWIEGSNWKSKSPNENYLGFHMASNLKTRPVLTF